jgi:hypothetical protein
MIIETRGDVVHLSGSLHKNQWMSIRAAANLLLHDHPQGIIVDCAGLENISEDGARTFLEAMRDIESARARIIVASLPQNVLTVIKTVPGVRSQLPIAVSVEAARASLKVQRRAPDPAPGADATRTGQVILVPLMAEVDLTYGADLAARLARVAKAEVRLVYLLEVTRTLPLNAPLPEQEEAAQEALSKAVQAAKQQNVQPQEHVERVREAIDGTLAAIRAYSATQIVVGASKHAMDHGGGHDRFDALVDTLLHRASCEVIVGRLSRE